MKILKEHSQKLSALIVGSYTLGATNHASAQADLGSIVTETRTSLADIPQLISAVLYIGGAILAAGGILALKKHVDEPAQNPIRNGLVRLIAGALLLVAPVAFKGIITTIGVDGSDSVGYTPLDTLGAGG
jgi:hypothetical protein